MDDLAEPLRGLIRAAGHAHDPVSFVPRVLEYVAAVTDARVVALALDEPDSLPSVHHRASKNLEPDDLLHIRERIDGTAEAGGALVHRSRTGSSSITLYIDPAPADTCAIEDALTLLGILSELAKARREAALDPLTGLLNRRSMTRSLGRLIAEGNRYGRTFSCVMLDLNNFKWFNDVYGHPVGDELLRALAHVLSTTVRGSDLACRWGGDEFLLALPETDPDAAAVILDRITVGLEGFLDGYRRDDVHLGFSAGVSYFPEDGTDADALIRAADERLYDTKRRVPVPRTRD